MLFVLVGHGSIGSKFNEELQKRGYEPKSIVIIDKNNDLLNDLRKKGHKCFNNIEEIDKNNNIQYGIVANWGPDHINSAIKLLELGCKRLVIEKPVSDSINSLKKFSKLVFDKSVFVTVHHHWKYLELNDSLAKIEQEYELGKPVGFRLLGGALGLSTNGVHWFDLALDILDSFPESIMADLDFDNINPRDESLAFIGGMCSYKMHNGSFLHLSYSNKNSQSGRAEVIYRNGIVDISIKSKEGKLKIYKRKDEDIERYFDKITRHGICNYVEEKEFINASTVPLVINDLINGKNPKVDLIRAENSLKMIIGAIQSSIKGNRVKWEEIIDQGIRIS